MILFKNDYTKGMIYDVHTTNQSFIKMHLLLKEMGIKNNKFFLTLIQKELAGIDPHYLKDNSEELKLKIAHECIINPWYYFREIVRVPSVGKAIGMPVNLTRPFLSTVWLYFNHIDIFLVSPRQVGKTVGTLLLDSYYIYINGINLSMALLTKDDKLRVSNIGKIKQIRDCMPKYLIYKNKRDSDNTKEITYNELDNKYLTFIAQKARMGAEELGRGMDIATQHWDELPYFRYAHIAYPAALSSTNAAVDTAKENGQPYSNIITTTAGRLDTKEGKFAYNLLLNSMTFSEKFYDFENANQLKEIVKKNSKQNMVHCEFSFFQSGKTLDWFKEKSRRSGGDADSIKRDYLNIWTFGSTESAVKDKLLTILRKNKKDPTYIQNIDNFIIKWYIDKSKLNAIKDMPLIIGSDPSENVGIDFFSFVFLNPIDMSIVATCRCNTTNLITVGLFIAEILYSFINSFLIIERNSTGVAILDVLFLELPKKGLNPFFKIYNDVIQNYKNEVKPSINIYDNTVDGLMRKKFGFRLTGGKEKGRTFLYKTVFFEALNKNVTKINDIDLIDEICGLQKKNGRIDHSSDNHDDLVIAYIYACYILLYGKNLKYYSFYKNNADKIMSQVTDNIKDVNEVTNDLLNQNLIIKKINSLENDIKKEKIETNKIIKLHQLYELKSMLETTNDPINIRQEKNIISFDKLSNRKKNHNTSNNDKTFNTPLSNYFSYL